MRILMDQLDFIFSMFFNKMEKILVNFKEERILCDLLVSNEAYSFKHSLIKLALRTRLYFIPKFLFWYLQESQSLNLIPRYKKD